MANTSCPPAPMLIGCRADRASGKSLITLTLSQTDKDQPAALPVRFTLDSKHVEQLVACVLDAVSQLGTGPLLGENLAGSAAIAVSIDRGLLALDVATDVAPHMRLTITPDAARSLADQLRNAAEVAYQGARLH